MSEAIHAALARRGEDRDTARDALAGRLGLVPVDEPEADTGDDTDKPVQSP